jgi:predicted secreted Zn-dependent protease
MGNKAIQRLVNRLQPSQVKSPTPGVYRTAARVQREEEEEESPGKTVFEPIDDKSYKIKAKTLSEAAAAMDAHDPEEWGKCEWDPQLDADFDTSTGAITKATVTVVITITMPKWKGAKKLSEAAKAEWDRFYQALLDHENGHVERVHTHLTGLGESLIGMTTEQANAECTKVMTELQTDSDEYDVDTDHGRNEGTIIDTSIE